MKLLNKIWPWSRIGEKVPARELEYFLLLEDTIKRKNKKILEFVKETYDDEQSLGMTIFKLQEENEKLKSELEELKEEEEENVELDKETLD